VSAYLASLLTVVGINLVLALSLNVITGFCGQVSLGHAAFYGVGAYTAAYLSKLGLPLAATLPAAALLACLIGVIVGLTSLRVRHDFLASCASSAGLAPSLAFPPFPTRGLIRSPTRCS
jgi:branched-chain amino acid transport system permease protein